MDLNPSHIDSQDIDCEFYVISVLQVLWSSFSPRSVLEFQLFSQCAQDLVYSKYLNIYQRVYGDSSHIRNDMMKL